VTAPASPARPGGVGTGRPGFRAGCVAHLWTWRPYTLWYVGLVGLAGGALASSDHPITPMLAAWSVPTLVWVAAHYLGDYFDRRLDAISKPQRPIPSGRLRPGVAVTCGWACVCSALVIAVIVNWRTAVVVAGAALGVVLYSRMFKARGVLGNLTRGVLTAAAFLFGSMMSTPLPPYQLLPMAAVFLAHDTASNLVGTVRDVDGDRAGGYQTLTVRHGVRFAVLTAMCFYTTAIVVATTGASLIPHSSNDYLVFVVAAASLGFTSFGMLLGAGSGLTARAALRAHEVLVVERVVLASALIVPGLGLPAAVALLVPALVVTGLSQATMRSRHEGCAEGVVHAT